MAIRECVPGIDRWGRELLEHGTPLFPIGCYHDDLPRETVPWHWHEELEAAVVESGTLIVCTDGWSATVGPGGGFFINAGILHQAYSRDNQPCRLRSMCFHPRLVGGGMDSVFWQKYIQPLLSDDSCRGIQLDRSVPWEREALERIEAVWQECAEERPGYELRTRGLLSELVFLLLDARPPIQRRPSVKELRIAERTKAMLQYIQEHFTEEIRVGDIARSAAVSESECLRCFRKIIGTTPARYVRQLRIQKAAGLLAGSEEKIVEIGARCGFQEMSYFARAFRDEMGCTPSEYRERKGAGAPSRA